jgi:squamous cell carcinoma antigen recognized by T-cells 3
MEDEEALLNSLSSTLTALVEDPHSIALHKTNISQNEEAGMDVEGARRLCTQYLAAPESVWIRLLKEGMEKVNGNPGMTEDVETVLQDFEAAEKDYLSIRIMKAHIEFLIELSRTGVLTEEQVSERIRPVVYLAEMDMERGQMVWTSMRDWELTRIENTSDTCVYFSCVSVANANYTI